MMITCVGGELAPQAIRTLKASTRFDIEVIAVDASAEATGRYFADHFEVVPRGDDPGYVDVIADLAGRYGADLILPWSDEEAMALVHDRKRLEDAGHQVACASVDALKIFNNKASTYAYLADNDINALNWSLAADVEAMTKAVAAFIDNGEDVVVKPADARGGRSVFVLGKDIEITDAYLGGREIHTRPEIFFEKHLADCMEDFPFVVSERLLAPTYDLDVLAWQGDLVQGVCRRRNNPAVPNAGHLIEQREDFQRIAERLAKALNLSWLYDCDIMLDRHGDPKVIEINPRPSGSVAVTMMAGVPMFENLAALAMGEQPNRVTLPGAKLVVPYMALDVVDS